MPVTSPASELSRTVPENTQIPPEPGSATNPVASSAEIGSALTRIRRSDTRPSYGAVVRCVGGLRSERVRRYAALQGVAARAALLERARQLGAGAPDRGGGRSG